MGVDDNLKPMSALVLHGEGALNDALGGQLLHYGPLTDWDPVPLSYREQDEGGRQETVEEDQQPCLVRRKPPQKQHGRGGGDGAIMEVQWHLDETGLSLHHFV